MVKQAETATGDGPKIDPVDAFIGQRVRIRRTQLGLSQSQVGDQIGVTFQQIQKFERAHNRITAKRLKQLSHVLNVELDYFFDGIVVDAQNLAIGADQIDLELLNQAMSSDLLNLFYKLNRRRRQAVLELIRNIAVSICNFIPNAHRYDAWHHWRSPISIIRQG